VAEIRVLERDAAGLVVTVPALRWGRTAFVAEAGWERLRALVGDAL
jgi:pilus assembly protein CpaF